jgi:predicted RNase H-like nuclease (RuvC/YqgF family)
MNEDKMITSLLDVAMNSAQEILVSSMRNKAEARVYADQVIELSNMVQALNERIQDITRNSSALENKVGHLDNALEQLSRTQNDLRLSEERYNAANEELIVLRKNYADLLIDFEKLKPVEVKEETKSSVKKFK